MKQQSFRQFTLLALLVLIMSSCTSIYCRQWANNIYGQQRTKIKKSEGSIDYHARKPRAK